MRPVVETLAWTAVLLGLWVATLTAVGTVELVAAAVSASACGVLATATRELLGTSLRPRPAWAGWLVRLPAAVVADLGRLAVAVVRTPPGTPLGTERTLALPDEPPARAQTRRALATAVVSATPGAYVTDVTAEGLVLHALDPEPSALERAVAR